MPYIASRRRRSFGDDAVNIDITTTEDASGGPAASSSNETAPAGGYVNKNGVCKATDDGALAQFKELQRQANRVLDAMGTAKIAVDGAIGPGTMAALRTISTAPSAGAYSLAANNINLNDCTAVSAQALVVTMRLSQLGDFMGASSAVSSPSPASTPTTVNPVTGVETPQGLTASAGDFLGNMSTTEKLGLAGLAVAVGYFAFKGKKR